MIYIKNNNSVAYIGQPPNYIGDFNGKEHKLNNGKLLYYDPNYNPFNLNSLFKEVYQDKLYDIFKDTMSRNPFLKLIPKDSGIAFHSPVIINKAKKKKSRNKNSIP